MSVKLPKGIDYSKYYGSNGMSTHAWGPAAWNFLFSSILGNYPIKINKKSREHLNIYGHYYNLCLSLQYTMPCIYCRNSFKDFLRELPVEPYLNGRIELMYWLYLMKDKVNNKLINQEIECYNDKKKELQSLLFSIN